MWRAVAVARVGVERARRPCRLERGRGSLEREHDRDHGHEGGREREAVEAEVDQGEGVGGASAYCRPRAGPGRDYAFVHDG